MHQEFNSCTKAVREFISRQSGSPGRSTGSTESEFDELALRLFRLQLKHNAPYSRFCSRRGHTPSNVKNWTQIPAMPTVGFKEFELTSLAPNQRTRVFHSSGTTDQSPSKHFHDPESLAVYETSLLSWFMNHLCPNPMERLQPISLTPTATHAPHSSLVHMLEIIARRLPRFTFTGRVFEDGSWAVDCGDTARLLVQAAENQTPVLLLGTAFSLVHLLDHLDESNERVTLPPGSSVMETGGYKGRSRALPKTELLQAITRTLGVPPSFIVSEYGMSELSSQAYDQVAGTSQSPGPANRSQLPFHFPSWARARVICPETGQEVEEGAPGLIQVLDLANVASVSAVRTEDLAIRRGPGFELMGRPALAEPRGCSLMSS